MVVSRKRRGFANRPFHGSNPSHEFSSEVSSPLGTSGRPEDRKVMVAVHSALLECGLMKHALCLLRMALALSSLQTHRWC